MGRKILCESCGSVLNEDILKARNSMNTCLVCGASLGGNDSDIEESQTMPEEELIDWYYYVFKSDPKSGTLRDKPIDLNKAGDIYSLKYQFQAPPRDENGKSDRAKEVLRKKYPDAFAPPDPNDIRYKSPGQLLKEGRCPIVAVLISS